MDHSQDPRSDIVFIEARLELNEKLPSSETPWWLPLTFIVPLAIGAVLAAIFWNWRVSHFPHSVATITSVWEVHIETGKANYTATYGKIAYQRNYHGRSYSCEVTKELGRPEDGFVAGQKLDVVPAASTCERVDIVRRILAPADSQ